MIIEEFYDSNNDESIASARRLREAPSVIISNYLSVLSLLSIS